MNEITRPRNSVPPAPPKIDAREFAALREFLRGYLHEDYAQERGSVREAVQQFARDADPGQRAEVARQWMTFVQLTEPQPLAVIVGLLTKNLGSAWTPRDPGQLDEFTRLIRDLLLKSGPA